MRVIIRLSLSGRRAPNLRHDINAVLAEYGIERVARGTYEGADLDARAIKKLMTQLWRKTLLYRFASISTFEMHTHRDVTKKPTRTGRPDLRLVAQGSS